MRSKTDGRPGTHRWPRISPSRARVEAKGPLRKFKGGIPMIGKLIRLAALKQLYDRYRGRRRRRV